MSRTAALIVARQVVTVRFRRAGDCLRTDIIQERHSWFAEQRIGLAQSYSRESPSARRRHLARGTKRSFAVTFPTTGLTGQRIEDIAEI